MNGANWLNATKPGQKPFLATHRGPLPPTPPSPAEVLLASLADFISATPGGGLVIKCGLSKLEIMPGMITITSGAASIRVCGPIVTINDGALEVQ